MRRDGTNSPDPKLRDTVYSAFDAARDRWAARGLALQGVANLYLPLWSISDLAKPHAAQARQHSGVILGAYCGNVSTTPPEEVEAHLDALFAAAAVEPALDVDLHIDEVCTLAC